MMPCMCTCIPLSRLAVFAFDWHVLGIIGLLVSISNCIFGGWVGEIKVVQLLPAF
jgi:hypothetical protein